MCVHTLTFGQQHLPERQSGKYISFVHLFIGGPPMKMMMKMGDNFSFRISNIRPNVLLFAYLLTLSGRLQMHECFPNEFIARAGRFVMVLPRAMNVYFSLFGVELLKLHEIIVKDYKIRRMVSAQSRYALYKLND